VSTLDFAIYLAVRAHAGQMDEDGMPHIVHCFEVMLRVKNFLEERPIHPALKLYSLDELLKAAILHDAVEDSGSNPNALEVIDLGQIEFRFGANVRKLVDGVTRRFDGKVKETYRDFIYRAREDAGTAVIKSCDLEHNYSRAFKIKSASWRNKLEFKYRVALKVLSSDRPTWEQASWQWQADPKLGDLPHPANGHFTIADPNGKRIEITEEELRNIVEAVSTFKV
jgi:(p)ppGpp synthase/HD superfamily hydrolase